LRYTITTMEEELNLARPEIKESLAFSVLDTDIATHVVVGVRWGANYIVRSITLGDAACPDSQGSVPAKLNMAIRQLGHLLTSRSEQSTPTNDPQEQGELDALDLTIFGDVLPGSIVTGTNHPFALARDFFVTGVHDLLSSTDDGRGKPILYTLMPLPLLGFFRLLDVRADLNVHQPSLDCLRDFMQHFDDAHAAAVTLERYVSRCRQYPSVVPRRHLREVELRLHKWTGANETLRSDLAKSLRAVRMRNANPDSVGQLLRDFKAGELSPSAIRSLAELSSKIDFVKKIMEEGSKYVGFDDPGLDSLLPQNSDGDTYVLYFNDAVHHESEAWDDTQKLFAELLRHSDRPKLVIAVDCDAAAQSLEKPYICQFRGRRMLIEDLVEHRKVLAANCVMQYGADTLDASLTSKPLQRRAIRISCPHPPCEKTLRCNWICAICQSPVEYGYVDERLYCDCRATPFDRWSFRCNDPRHASAWACYDEHLLHSRLKDLEPFEDVNILILGETGVGKSTWINAFVNYHHLRLAR
jgi:hypothetical protein